jgi:hypothetical protein
MAALGIGSLPCVFVFVCVCVCARWELGASSSKSSTTKDDVYRFILIP